MHICTIVSSMNYLSNLSVNSLIDIDAFLGFIDSDETGENTSVNKGHYSCPYHKYQYLSLFLFFIAPNFITSCPTLLTCVHIQKQTQSARNFNFFLTLSGISKNVISDIVNL